MTSWFLVAFSLQSFFILFDELVFHRSRFLPRWERWGHPLDTFFLMVPLMILVLSGSLSQTTYGLAAAFSCLFVTKDEWVHRQYCRGMENWLHALLFIMHPIVLFLAWKTRFENPKLIAWLLIAPAFFMIYQIYYWNFYAKRTVANR